MEIENSQILTHENSQILTPKKRAHRKKITDAQILEAIKNGGGTDAGSAVWIKKHYGISVDRTTINKRVLANPELLKAKEDVDDDLLDTGVTKFRDLVYQGDKSAIFFLLKYKGKKRGFINQYSAEISNKDNEPFKISVQNSELDNMTLDELMELAEIIHDNRVKMKNGNT